MTSAKVLMLTFACLAFAAPAEAGVGATSFGAQMNFPVPARDIGDTQLGMDVGVTLTRMEYAYVGVGADLIYHYWPASAGYEAAFDRYLGSTRFEALDGSTWAFTALQVTGHVKFVAPSGLRCTPWVQVGAGGYGLNRNLDERRPVGTYAWVMGPGLGNISIVPGGYGEVGLDFHASSRVVLGLDATFQYVRSRDTSWTGVNDLPDFSAFTVGTHVLFGWE
ncbi:MAG: hypothetical protein HYR74_12600 [Candidatus Eisenbacteria bacterium]|nr:hypothetical protein [Candidatus Eisenbacteria bacterium]